MHNYFYFLFFLCWPTQIVFNVHFSYAGYLEGDEKLICLRLFREQEQDKWGNVKFDTLANLFYQKFKIPYELIKNVLCDHDEKNTGTFSESTFMSLIEVLVNYTVEAIVTSIDFFKTVDRDIDNYISKNEFQYWFKYNDEQCLETFCKFDTNNDDKLNLIDFIKFIESIM